MTGSGAPGDQGMPSSGASAPPPEAPAATPPTPPAAAPAAAPAQVQISSDQLKAMWAKFEAGERWVAYGAGLILIAWVLGIFGGWADITLALIGAVISMAAVYVRHSPTMKVTWPAPYPTILLAISLITGLMVLVPLLRLLPYLGIVIEYAGVLGLIAIVLGIVGGALMVWGSYQLFQASRMPTPPAA